MPNMKLDSSGDIIIGRGVARIQGVEYVAQLIKNRLKTFYGEWELDTELGVPWLSEVLIHNYGVDIVYSRISDTIVGTEGVSHLVSLDLRIDKEQRVLHASFVASSIYGQVNSTVNI